jgi:hypothetical protein
MEGRREGRDEGREEKRKGKEKGEIGREEGVKHWCRIKHLCENIPLRKSIV